MKYRFEFEGSDVVLISEGLGKLPYEQVAKTVLVMQKQINLQNEAARNLALVKKPEEGAGQGAETTEGVSKARE